MASWTAHLQRVDDRARADCPHCRGRLGLPLEAIVGRRTQAMIAAGVLALSSTAPAAALAGDTDQDQEGATVPEQVVAVEQPTDPAFDPGGNATDVPFDAPPAPTVQPAPEPADDAATIEPEPATDEEAPVADPGDGSEQPPAGQALTPPPTAPPAPAPVVPVPVAPEPAETVPAPAPPAPAEAPVAPPSEAKPAKPDEQRALPRKRSSERHAIAPTAASAVPAPQPTPVDAPPAVSATAVPVAHASSEANDDAQRGDRFHVVARGESLWSIASDLLGDGASTAQVARKVDRLWDLNHARIQTGDPDLLMAGTKLALH